MAFDETSDVVLVGDVNDKYDIWCASSLHMFDAIKVK